jgi:hypothetical protein
LRAIDFEKAPLMESPSIVVEKWYLPIIDRRCAATLM